MIERCKVLALNKAHISSDTAGLLDRESEENNVGVSVYPKISPRFGNIGYFVYFNPNDMHGYKAAPEDLMACMHLARDAGASVICFDMDGPIVPYLRVYDGEAMGRHTCLAVMDMITVSTAHIKQTTDQWLQDDAKLADSVNVYPKGDEEDFGYFVYMTELSDTKDLPDDLRTCVKLARDMGARILCLDCDGPEMPYLTRYDW